MDNSKKTTRRDFMKKSAITAAGVSFGLNVMGAATVKPVLGANDKIRMGFIGVGNRGSDLMHRFMAFADVEVAALCDVYEPFLSRDYTKVNERYLATGKVPRMGETFANKVNRYQDFRKLLEQKDIDAVCIATPDHWHAIQAIQAMEAGKDVYVEKPLTITIHEGRKMVQAADRTNRVVQVGLNRRGSSIYQEVAGLVKGDKIGRVSIARAYRISNMYPNGIGRLKPEAPPADLDWDLWLGPRPYRPYQYNIAPYFFRWWQDYSTQMGNWGVHYLDVIRWMIGEQAPIAVTAHGGKYVLDDDRTIPDTMEVTFEFASGAIAIFGIYEANGVSMFDWGEVEFRGTKGTMYTRDTGYKIIPARPGQFQDWNKLVEAEEKIRKDERKPGEAPVTEASTNALIRNFLDCIKSRKSPFCPLEEGHRSTTFAHLANISLELGMRIEWDAEKEMITNNKYANNFLHYEYRQPWQLS